MAKLLKCLGWLSIICGIIVGIFASKSVDKMNGISSYPPDKSFHLSILIAWWISGAVTGIVFIAIGIVLERTKEILNNQETILRKLSPSAKEHTYTKLSDQPNYTKLSDEPFYTKLSEKRK